jgi:hypothetical protein
MLDLQRLTIIRQRRLAQSLAETTEDKAFVKTLATEVRTALSEAVTAGQALDSDHILPPLLVDNSTDTVFGAFDAFVASIVRGMTDRVIAPLPAPQAKKKAAAAHLRQRAFPHGVEFLSRSMPLQYDAMVSVIDILREDPACVAAVNELGAGYFVDHMEAHLAPYGRAVRTTDDRDMEAVGTAFHAAYVRLVVKITAYHADAATIEMRLCNPYQHELAAQREEERLARVRSKTKKAEAAKASKQDEEPED